MAKKPEVFTRWIAFSDLIEDPLNANVVDEATMDKIAANIKQNGGFTPPLVVRPQFKGKLEPPYVIVDGHHRLRILRDRFGKDGWECQLVDVSERQGRLMLATLNRLKGTDDLKRRAELVQSLVESIPQDQLAALLPESVAEIEDLLRLNQVDLDALEAAQRGDAERNDAESPRQFSVLLFPAQEAIVRQALERMKATADIAAGQKMGDGMALEFLAAEWLAGAPPERDSEVQAEEA